MQPYLRELESTVSLITEPQDRTTWERSGGSTAQTCSPFSTFPAHLGTVAPGWSDQSALVQGDALLQRLPPALWRER